MLVSLSFGVGSCDGSGSDGPTVVLYYSADDAHARPIIELFEAQTGIRVVGRTDTEATKTTGLVQRLRAERSRPRADVFWSSEVFLTIQLADEGILEAYSPRVDHGRPGYLHDPQNRWHGFALRSRVLVYNTNLLNPDWTPHSLWELREAWVQAAPFAMANPAFGTTRGHVAALVAAWGADDTRRFLRSLRSIGFQMVDGNSSVVRTVAYGQAAMGLTDTDDVWAGKRNGWPVEMIYICHDHPEARAPIGPLVIPNTVARVKQGPNPEAASALIEFLLDPIVERMLADAGSHHIPTHPSLVEEYRDLVPPSPMSIPYAEIAAQMDTAMRIVREELSP